LLVDLLSELTQENSKLQADLDIRYAHSSKLESRIEELEFQVQATSNEREVWKNYIRELESRVNNQATPPVPDSAADSQDNEVNHLMSELEVAYQRIAASELEIHAWKKAFEEGRDHFLAEKQTYARSSSF
jgi:predicted nuclease with TOPRIM domain